MSWNYRVLKTQAKGDVPVWAVHRVFYDESGAVTTWSVEPTHPLGETWGELDRDAVNYARAFQQRALDVTSGTAVELTATGMPKRQRGDR